MSTATFLAGRRPVIPDTVSHALANHPMVQCITGPPGHQHSARLALAPFDDMILLFASRGSATVEGLAWENSCQVLASWSPPSRPPPGDPPAQGGGEPAPDGGPAPEPEIAWNLVMKGRAVVAGSVNSHAYRLEAQPWIPEGSRGSQLLAVEFQPHWIEYTEGEGEGRKVWYGPTQAANIPTVQQRWFLAAFQGILPLLALGLVAEWAWFVMAEVRLRWIVAILSGLATFGLLGGVRLLYRVAAYRKWQQGLGLRVDAGHLATGWISVQHAMWLGVASLGTALFLLLLVSAAWGAGPAGVALLTSQVWLLGPYWVGHLLKDFSEVEEARRDARSQGGDGPGGGRKKA